ncbi:MAG TPA: hypothetical protein VFT87_05290 [Candidatus Saccharimonadales bacterium]|nr:hypothetical protein [Candidatus Saccharimonadales bacterium]
MNYWPRRKRNMMQSRLVENWLIKAKELTYTVPFAQLLALKGYRILHISKGGSVEQGKDIIAIDKNGDVHCYQLKCGDIGTTQWRAIKTEVDELVQIPPKHPSLPTDVKVWHSYLVTNGMLNNTSARTIDDYSREMSEKGFSKLQTILKDELVEDFTDFYGSFFPDSPEELQAFLGIYNQPGDDTLSNQEYKTYFERYFSGINTKSKQKKLEAINASVIICSYLLTNKYATDNHAEIIKAWTLLLVTIYEYAYRQGIKDKEISDTEQLIFEALELAYRQLIDEVVQNETMLVDGKYDLLSEPFMVHKIRCTELLGLITAYFNYCILRNIEPYCPEGLVDKLVFMSKNKAILGEAYIPLILNYVVFLLRINKGDQAIAELNGLLSGLLSTHGRNQPGTPSPYYSLVEAAEIALDLEDSPVKESFEGRSYALWSVVLLLARLEQRELLSHHWRLISYVSCQELEPEDTNDLLLWRCDKGVLQDKFPNPEQSWKLLQEEANRDYSENLPEALQVRKHIVPFWLNVMPQRLTKSTLMAMLKV